MKYKQGEELREFSCLYKELEDLYHNIALKIGLSDSAFEVLYAVCALDDGCSQADICQLAFVSKQTINSSIRKLEREQMIYKTRGKGRTLHIHLTEQGRLFARKYIEPVIHMENAAFRRMDQAESREFLRLTRKYVDGIRQGTEKMLASEEKI